MKRSEDKIGIKSIIAILCFILLIVIVGLFTATHEGMVGQGYNERLADSKILSEIYKNTLEYRLAEMEHFLSLKEEEMNEYENRMKLVLQRVERNQEKYRNMLSSQEKRETYEKFISDWQAYLENSRKSIALSKGNFNGRATVALMEKSRGSFQALRENLDRLVESNEKHANSLSYCVKEWFREYRLTLNFLYICGMTAIFILIFNFYDKAKKYETINNRRKSN
jgi:methyl-accepting chemotaxis protein